MVYDSNSMWFLNAYDHQRHVFNKPLVHSLNQYTIGQGSIFKHQKQTTYTINMTPYYILFA